MGDGVHERTHFERAQESDSGEKHLDTSSFRIDSKALRMWDIQLLFLPVCVLLLAAMAAAGTAWEQYKLLGKTKPEPARLSIRELSQNGPPPDNAFIELTDFTPGKWYAHSGTYAWVPYFATERDASGRTPVVVVEAISSKEWVVARLMKDPSPRGIFQQRGTPPACEKSLKSLYPEVDFGSTCFLHQTITGVPTRKDQYVALAVLTASLGSAAWLVWLYFRWRRRRLRDFVSLQWAGQGWRPGAADGPPTPESAGSIKPGGESPPSAS